MLELANISKRFRALVADLEDSRKAKSPNVDAKRRTVDMVVVAKQVCTEYDQL